MNTSTANFTIINKIKILFVPSNDTHTKFMHPLKNKFPLAKFMVLLKNENADYYLDSLNENYIRYEQGVLKELAPDLIVFGNDWGPSEKLVISEARENKIPTICMQEGPLDFVSLRSERLMNADYIFLLGSEYKKYLNRESGVFITGNPKFDDLFLFPKPDKPKVMINCNFTYGVFEDIRDQWISDVVEVCKETGIDFFVSKHPRDNGIMPDDIEVINSNAYKINDQLQKASIVISRFSTVIYESLYMGREVIYYNPHDEQFGIFSEDDTKGIWLANNKQDLRQCLIKAIEIKHQMRSEKKEFLRNHCNAYENNSAIDMCVNTIIQIVESRNQTIKELKPYFSIILPTYNRPEDLDKAIKSIKEQTFQDFEIIIVNDNGVDVKSIIDSYPDLNIRYIKHSRNLGLAESRNSGLRIAMGKYITYLDDDDLYYSNHLSVFHEFFENNPEYDIAYSNAIYSHQELINGVYKQIDQNVPFSIDYDDQKMLIKNITPVLCVCHHRDCIDSVGYFNSSLKRYEDWEYWLRFSREFRFKHINITTCQVNRRYDGSSMVTKSKEPFSFAYLCFIYKFIDYANENTKREIEIKIRNNLKILEGGLHRGILFNGPKEYEAIFEFSNLSVLISEVLYLKYIYDKKYNKEFELYFIKILMLLYACNKDETNFYVYNKKIEAYSKNGINQLGSKYNLQVENNNSLTWSLANCITKILYPIRFINRRIKFRKNIHLLESSDFFNKSYYLDNNPDVLQSRINPTVHYLLYGGFEGRNPSPNFNSSYYLEMNPDVARENMNPLLHYLLFGKNEGRPIKK